MENYKTSTVNVGNLAIGGNNPVLVQSMCDTDTRNVEQTVAQILSLEKEGCEIIRIAIPDMEAAKAVGKIKEQIHIPLVADIHFSYQLALEVVKQGIDKVRINPGNIGAEHKVQAVVKACKEKNIPIRIGVNVGSIERDLLAKYGPTPQAAVESCLGHVQILEKLDFTDIVLSIKFNDVPQMVKAYRMLAEKVLYPLHVGVTHSGTSYMGTIKNAIGIGTLIQEGIGNTIRVSLTAPPEEEVRAGWAILRAVGSRQRGPEIISCPTCGRTEINLLSLTRQVEKVVADANIKEPIKVAVMGCAVNGPGEGREADIGIAGGKKAGVIFVKGEIVKTAKEEDLLAVFTEELHKLITVGKK